MRPKSVFLLVMVALAGLVPLTPGAAADQTFLETFNSCLVGTNPPCDQLSNPWFQYTSVVAAPSTFSVSATNAIGSKSLRIDDQTSADQYVKFDFENTTSTNFCLGGGLSWSFAFLVQTVPTGSPLDMMIVEKGNGFISSGSTYLGFRLTTAGVLQGIVDDPTNSAVTGDLGSVAPLNWYNVTIDQTSCGNGAVTKARFTAFNGTAQGTVQTAAVSTDAPDDKSFFMVRQEANGDNFFVYIDNVQLAGFTGVASGPPIAAGPGVTLNGDLAGFDVDDTGTTLIVRESDTESNHGNVTVISANTMLNTSNPQSTECAQLDGVMAEQSVVGFIWCTGGNPGNLAIRGTTLGAPAYLDTCSFCTSNISLSLFTNPGGDGMLELGEIAVFPLSHSRVGTTGNRELAWAFSGRNCAYPCGGSNPGVIGFDAYSIDNGGALGLTRSAEYGGVNKGAEDICVSPTSSTSWRIIAAHESSATNRYVVSSQTGTLVLENSYSGLQGSRGVSCTTRGDSKVLIGVERGASIDEAWLVNTTTGIAYWTGLTGIDLPARGVAVSGDGKWFAVVDGNNIHVGNATSGNITGTAVKPTGTFYGIEMEPFGQAMWVCTTKNCTRYALTAFTTITPCCALDIPPTPGDDGAGLTGAGGPLDPAVVGSALGVGAFGGALFISTLMIIGMAVGTGTVAYQTTRNAAVTGWGLAVGAIGGFLISWAFGWLGVGSVFVVIILLVAMIVFKVRRPAGD